MRIIGLILLFVFCSQNCEAGLPKTIYNSVTFDDGTTVTEAVDFTESLTKAIKSDAKLPNTLKEENAKEQRGVGRITKMKECMAEVESMRDIYGQPDRERDTIKDNERLKTRLEVFAMVFYYLADNDIGLFETLFKKYNYNPKYAKRLRYIYKWDTENLKEWSKSNYQKGTEEYFRLRNHYIALVDDLVREALYEHNAMSEYEVSAYKADRCKLMAVDKDPDLIKEHVKNITKTINELWTGFYAPRVREMKRKGKLAPND